MRYVVGIVLTVVCGRWAIRWLQAYLARQKTIEALPEPQRKNALMRYCFSCGTPANVSLAD